MADYMDPLDPASIDWDNIDWTAAEAYANDNTDDPIEVDVIRGDDGQISITFSNENFVVPKVLADALTTVPADYMFAGASTRFFCTSQCNKTDCAVNAPDDQHITLATLTFIPARVDQDVVRNLGGGGED